MGTMSTNHTKAAIAKDKEWEAKQKPHVESASFQAAAMNGTLRAFLQKEAAREIELAELSYEERLDQYRFFYKGFICAQDEHCAYTITSLSKKPFPKQLEGRFTGINQVKLAIDSFLGETKVWE